MKLKEQPLLFAAIVCVVCSLFVSSAATLLKERQETNKRIDKQKNILACLGVLDPAAGPFLPAEIANLYSSSIEEAVLDDRGDIVREKSPADLDPAVYLDPRKAPNLLPIYLSKDADGNTLAYAFPIAGMGLWSTLYGYLAIEPDAETVKGITFYAHGETPGLGAEIEKAWFQNNFKGKKILNAAGKLVSVSVVKGKVSDVIPEDEAAHYVDGISGATMTSKGVTALVRIGLERYEPFFAQLRKK